VFVTIPDAVVIGAGHNGLVAANVLADAGWAVVVHEAEPEPGGAVRSGELVEPGFVSDRYSSFYPLGAASPVFRALGLEIPWRHGPVVLAHPAEDGSCAVLERRRDARWERVEPALLKAMTTPFPQLRAAPGVSLFAPFLRLPAHELERRIVIGNALHTDAPPTSFLGRAFGAVLTGFGRHYGYPCVAGGAAVVTRLLAERAERRGVEIRCGERIERVPSTRRAVIAAIDGWSLAELLGRRWRMPRDPGVVKVDWTLEGPIPWSAEPALRSPVVHIGGQGAFTIVGQYSMADQSRMPAGKEVAWAYSRDLDAASMEHAIERLAPGFRTSIRGRHIEELPPGRLNGGTARRLRLRGPEVAPGIFLASMSAHPGGGVHGAPGWIAAQEALAR
jgi:phytoene dehydrogenase-like protein